MSWSRLSLVALLVTVLGLWHMIYADHHARFVLELFEVNHASASNQLNDEQVQEILAKLEDLRLENDNLRVRSLQIVRHIAESSTQWKSLRDLTKFSTRAFISEVISRDHVQGPPEIFEFPSALSNGQHLCLKGNHSSNGTRNSYTFAWPEAFPKHHLLLNGTTLISETQFDYNNPWHSMYNLIQFVYWKLHNQCSANANHLILYHWSELRKTMGKWITQVFTAAGLPTEPEDLADGERPVCFERALVSRLGIAGMPNEMLRGLYGQVRCQARTFCKLPTTRATKPSMNITLMVRSGAREWKDPEAWERAIDEECGKVEGCRWRTMWVGNMTYCEQVERMMETDVLVSVHGAQLTNMIFMSPGGRVLEMFPKGWLEHAGGGQFIYRQLAKWNGLIHEGYWRDDDHPDCPANDDNAYCFAFFKDRNVGINATYISSWLGGVLDNFKSSEPKLAEEASGSSDVDSRGDHKTCTCMAKIS